MQYAVSSHLDVIAEQHALAVLWQDGADLFAFDQRAIRQMLAIAVQQVEGDEDRRRVKSSSSETLRISRARFAVEPSAGVGQGSPEPHCESRDIFSVPLRTRIHTGWSEFPGEWLGNRAAGSLSMLGPPQKTLRPGVSSYCRWCSLMRVLAGWDRAKPAQHQGFCTTLLLGAIACF